MSPVPMISTPSALSSHVLRLFGGFVQVIDRVRDIWAQRRAAAELATLDAHQLKDIGLTRSDVLGAIERPLNDDPTAHLARLVRERRAAQTAAIREAREIWRF